MRKVLSPLTRMGDRREVSGRARARTGPLRCGCAGAATP